jgi:hypothetical protein
VPPATADPPAWAPAIAPETKLPVAAAVDGYLPSSFDTLACYDPALVTLAPPPEEGTAPDPLAGIPGAVRALSGRRISVAGFMIPIDFEGNDVRSFMLCRYQQGCCFGHVPQIHEWIFVTTPPERPVRFVLVPVTVYGTLDVGRKFEEGNQAGVYRLVADRLVVPEDW